MDQSHTFNVSRQSSQPSSSAGLATGVPDEPVEAAPSSVDTNNTSVDEPSPPAREPPFALLSDGRILVSIKALENRDLRGLDVWTGVILTPPNAEFVMHRAENAAYETAAHLAGRYPAASKSSAT